MAKASARTRTARDLTGVQRAAVLVMYLEHPVATRVLKNLTSEELKGIGVAMAEVEHIEPSLIEEVVAEFVRDLTTMSMVPTTGREYALGVFPGLIDEGRRARIHSNLKRQISHDFAEYIASRPARTVATILQDEHPQTQAVALLLMGPDTAGDIMALLDEHERFDISMRMATIKHIPGDMADDVEASLRESLEDRGSDRWSIEGLDQAAQTLGRLGVEARDELLARVAKQDPALAENLRRRMVVFSDLGDLDGRSVQALLKNIDRKSMILALRGADGALRDLFLDNMSSRAASDLRDELEIMGPVPRSEVEAAQEEIVQVALGMQEEGVIRITGAGAEDMV